MTGNPVAKVPRILMVSDGDCVHARRPLQWVRDLGYDTIFLDIYGTCDKARIPGPCFPFPEMNNPRLMRGLLGAQRSKSRAEEIQRRRVSTLLSKWKPDLVHCHWIGHQAWVMAKAEAPNLVLTAWGTDINQFFDSDQSEEARQRVGEALAACRLLVGDAEDIRHKAEILAGRPLNWKFIPLGIATEPYRKNRETGRAAWRERLGVPPDTFLFASVRAWSANYRHDQILEAFAQACQKSPTPLGLLFKVYPAPGGAGFLLDENRLRQRAAELGVQDRVWWARNVPLDELPKIHAAADAIVNYPRRDALPVTFFEAAAARKPVVTCWFPAYDIPLVRDNFCVVKSSDVRDLAEAMATLPPEVARGEWDKRLAAAECEVEKHFTEAATIEALRRLYAELPGVHPPTIA